MDSSGTRNPSGSGKLNFPVVGMGGSAGSLEAFTAFFHALPGETGLAFVVVSHLDPNHISLLPELLQKKTAMPVYQVEEAMEVKPNHVFVIPPNQQMRIEKGVLRLYKPSENRANFLPIDNFFQSLALDQGANAVAIIFSGTGSDGTLGLKEIKSEMGMVMVQEENTAKYGGMPGSAIGTGVADFILPPEKMPEQLINYSHYLLAGKPDSVSGIPLARKEYDALEKIFFVINTKTNHDFSQYKNNTVWRRIERRMHLHQIDDIDAYVQYLQESDREVDDLFNELLIGVTNFFRDAEAFEALQEKVLYDLLESKPDGNAVRVWIPGCSSGEEAYSIAILLHECMYKINSRFNFQIFATDIDKRALETARTGIYPSTIVSDIDPVRLNRYFTILDNGQYQIKKSIREALIFAPQNILSDPPFTKLDLISCRNLLIYLDTELQHKLISMFHHCLNSGGVLFLGSSETVSHDTDLFATLDAKWKIFRRKPNVTTAKPQFNIPLVSAGNSVKQYVGKPVDISGDFKTIQLIEAILHESNTPPCVIVDSDYSAVYIHGRTGKYLEPAEGKASMNILQMARPGLKTELINAICKAGEGKREFVRKGLKIRLGSQPVCFDLTVKPILEHGVSPGLMMVVFKERKIPARTKATTALTKQDQINEDLAEELEHTKQTLQSTIEELEIANEELRSANEELQSTNEELQSANEELETSKEELQSLNEESATVNAEMQCRLDELSKAHDDMKNFLDSTEIATVFLDTDLCIRRFTPKLTDIIPLAGNDSGRPISHFATNLINVELTELAQQVLEDLAIRTMEVDSKDNRHYLLRVRPYRTVNNVIDGVVMTFEDVTDLRQTKDSLRESEQRLSMAFRATNDMIWDYDFEHSKVWCNEGFIKMFGYRPKGAEDSWHWWSDHVHPDDRIRVVASCQAALDGGGDRWYEEYRHRRLAGGYADIIDRAYIARDSRGKAIRMIGAMLDITERKQAAEEIRTQREMLRIIFDTTPCMLVFKDQDSVYRMVNKAFGDFLDKAENDIIGITDMELFPRNEAELYRQDDIKVMKSGKMQVQTEKVTGAKGKRLLQVTKTPVLDSSRKCIGILCSVRELNEQATKKFEAMSE